VRLEFYGPDLELLGSLTGQPTDAGANWSHVTTLTGVAFDENGDPEGPVYCVAFAKETAEDGALNRDGQPKPAVPKGTTQLERIPLFLHIDGVSPNEKETVGGFIVLNNDDDNGSGIMDAEEAGQVVEENDLKRLIVTWDPAVVNEGTLRLKCTAGAGLVRVFAQPDRWGPWSLPIVYIDDGTPQKAASYHEYWIEGCGVSGSLRDVTFELVWERDQMDTIKDIVKATVWNAEIDECEASWMPAGKLDAPTEVTATVRIKPQGVEGTIQVYLHSTAWPGYCMNAPTDESESFFGDYDLKMQPQEGVTLSCGYLDIGALACRTACTDDLEDVYEQMATTESPQNQLQVTLECRDYGAWGNLVGLVQVADTVKLANIPGDWCKRSSTYPIDEQGNFIADCWQWSAGDATDDDEDLNGQGDPDYPGDGFTRFEEYRGFMVQGNHVRTNPDDDKDIFLVDVDDLGPGFFASSGVTLRFVGESEAGTSYAVNPNSTEHSIMTQYAVPYIDGGVNYSGWWGYAGGDPGVPADSHLRGVAAIIYTETIEQASGPYDAEGGINSTIAHELGHRIAIWHHLPEEAGDQDCVMVYGDPRWENPRSTFCTDSVPEPGDPSTGACLLKWRLHNLQAE
jgi:hypothetical protein